MKLLVINGPNINMLGIREPDIYGTESYAELIRLINAHAAELGIAVENFQSNHEGAIVDKIQAAYFDGIDGIVINPAAYAHERCDSRRVEGGEDTCGRGAYFGCRNARGVQADKLCARYRGKNDNRQGACGVYRSH